MNIVVKLKDASGQALCRRCRLPKVEGGHERGCTWFNRQQDAVQAEEANRKRKGSSNEDS